MSTSSDKKIKTVVASIKRRLSDEDGLEDYMENMKRLMHRSSSEVEVEDEHKTDEEEDEDEQSLFEYQVVAADDESLSSDPTIIKVGAKEEPKDEDPVDKEEDEDEEPLISCPCNSTCHRTILLSLARIQRNLQANNQLLRRVLSQGGSSSRFLAIDSPVLPVDFPVALPITDVADLDILEEYLGEGNKFAATLPFFTSLGGSDAKKAFKRIMNALLTYETGKNLNWRGKGRRNKTAFDRYIRIHNLIFHSVKQNPKALEVTLSDIEKFIKEWLRFAPDRFVRFVQGKEASPQRKVTKRDEDD